MSPVNNAEPVSEYIVPDRNNIQSNDGIDRLRRQINVPRRWSQLSYAGESRVPQGVDPTAGSWPLFILGRNRNYQFATPDGRVIDFEIQNPNNFDFEEELQIVQRVLMNLTNEQRAKAEYWGDGPPTKQWTPIIDRLIDTYDLTEVRAARVLAAAHGSFNDALVVTWYFKYLYDMARPNQLDQSLITAICTPKFPSYPSGHSVLAGTAEVVLSYFFPAEAKRLKELAEECAVSRLFGGVHFPADINEGLRLGRNIGRLVVGVLSSQRDINQIMVDIPFIRDKHADLPPPPYEQVIPFPPRYNDCDLPLLP